MRFDREEKRNGYTVREKGGFEWRPLFPEFLGLSEEELRQAYAERKRREASARRVPAILGTIFLILWAFLLYVGLTYSFWLPMILLLTLLVYAIIRSGLSKD